MSANFTIRPWVLDDAAHVLSITRRVAAEPANGLLHSSQDPFRTVEEQQKVMEQRMATDNCTMFVAEVNGNVVGFVSATGGVLIATRQTAGLGITIDKEWRGQGIGTALMQRAVEWARHNPAIKRLELEVFTTNANAQRLYEKVGFQVEGIKRSAYFKDERFVDSVMMAIIFER